MRAIQKRNSEICVECQLCCRELHFNLGRCDTDEGKDAARFFGIRGLAVVSENNHFTVIVPHTCQHLDPLIGCEIYEDRPIDCRVYDGRRDPVMRDRCALNRPKRKPDEGSLDSKE
jgi:hypothetical protein